MDKNKAKDGINKSLMGWQLLLVSDLGYFMNFLIGGIMGASFGLIGFICLLLAIVVGIKNIIKKEESNKNTAATILGVLILFVICSLIGNANANH